MSVILRIICRILGLLPESALVWLAKFLTALEWYVFHFRKAVVLKNLRIAFANDNLSNKQIASIGKQSIMHTILTFLEFMYTYAKPFDNREVNIIGKNYVDDALAQGNGAYILCGHLGNWEAMGTAYNQKIAPTHVIVKKVGSDSTDNFVNSLRRKNKFIPIIKKTRGNVVRDIFKALGKNEIVGFILDQSRPGSPKLDFFGHPAKTNTSLATIAAKRSAPILPSYIYRQAVNKHTIVIMPPLALTASGDGDQDMISNSLMFNKVLEGMIKKHPEQYFWMHNRWKD